MMATQAGGLIQNKKRNVHFDVAPSGLNTNTSKPQKTGGLGGRKALNDISNSGRPSTLQTSKKNNSMNVISIAEDFGPSNSRSSFGGKKNVSKAPEKQAGGRKALGDLTNSVKPRVLKEFKQNQEKKLSAVVEEMFPSSTGVDEHFLHDHRECIKAREKNIDLDYFLKTVGLDEDNSMHSASPCMSPKMKPESPTRFTEMEEIPELGFEDQSEWKKIEIFNEGTLCGSPKSPKLCSQWTDYKFHSFMLMETPKLLKH